MGSTVDRRSGTARKLRARMTDAEHKLWHALRNRQLGGHKFVRQLPVGPFIADFACREVGLIVEVDGGQHAGSGSDERRTRQLEALGYSVIRFWNDDVLKNLDGVLDVIKTALSKAPSPGRRFATTDLSPGGRGKPDAYARAKRERQFTH